MKDKICLITGANSGIGFALAKGMAQKDFITVMLCRNKNSGEYARNEIIESTKNTDVHLMIADLSSQSSIRAFVTKFNAKYDHLDILFNNAGANFFNRQLTDENIEMTFAVNYLAPFLMTNLLLPKLEKSLSSRVVNTVGDYNKNTVIHFDDINLKESYSVTKASAQSILAKFLFTYELNRKLMGSDITINCFHPGATKTNLQKKMPFLWKILAGIMRPFFQRAEKGAKTGLYLATSEEMENISGKYYQHNKETDTSKISYDLVTAKKLWELSETMTKETKKDHNSV